MPVLEINGIECHGSYQLAQPDDPPAGEIGLVEYESSGIGVSKRVSVEQTFVESPYWWNRMWSDAPINTTFGLAAALLTQATGEVVDSKEDK